MPEEAMFSPTAKALVGSPSANVSGSGRTSFSVRRRLPAFMFALLVVLGSVFSWMAYREVQRVLRASGVERIAAAGGQVADLLGQSANARIAELKRLAADPQVQLLVHNREAGAIDHQPASLQAFAARNPLAVVWLYSGELPEEPPRQLAIGTQLAREPLATPPHSPPTVGMGPLQSQGGRVWYYTTVPIDTAPKAFLSIQRSINSAQGVGLIERLIGSGAVLKFGNAAGDVWTDLAKPVAPPPLALAPASATYKTAEGSSRIGTAVPVQGTPWLIWTDVAETTLLQPAYRLLERMLPFMFGFAALAAFAVYAVSRRITTPLEQVARAAEAIAAGDRTPRVVVTGDDEIGRLGTAFNVMATRVAESHDELEARVQARTQDLEHARRELDQFFSLSLDLLCIADIDGRFRRVNPAWEKVLGWTSADLTSMPYLELVHPDDVALTTREANKLAAGETTLAFENRYRAKDGTYRWLSWKAAPLSGLGLIYAVAHDVTEQKRTERALHRHAADLATANRELEAFSYSVSHDLRAPLRSIDGFSQALVEDYGERLDETGRNFLSRIRAAAQRMGTLIDDLLSLSRVTRQELTRSDLDLTAVAHDIANRLQETDPQRQVQWRFAAGLTARGDARLIRIALENLLSNAWKFTANHAMPVIEFTTSTLPDGTRAFVIRDNGAGFDPTYAGKLFGAFQRLHDAREFPGTGIGLATVQRIVFRHGGRIWAESAVNQGASFFFTVESGAV